MNHANDAVPPIFSCDTPLTREPSPHKDVESEDSDVESDNEDVKSEVSSGGSDNEDGIGTEALCPSTLALLNSFLCGEMVDDEPAPLDSSTVFQAYTPGDMTMISATVARLEAEKAKEDAKFNNEVLPHIKSVVRQLLASDETPLALQLEVSGVVRVNNVLSSSIADRCLALITTTLAHRIAQNDAGEVVMDVDTGFGAVHAKVRRWDMYLRPEGVYEEALRHMLSDPSSQLHQLFSELFPADAGPVAFHEFSSLVSNAGAPSQPIHPDSKFTPLCPLYTIFVALQDIDEDMGPTHFLPGTHNSETHVQHQNKTTKNDLLRRCNYRQGTMKKGDCAVMDSRCLHSGWENTKGSRTLMYFTLRNPAHSLLLEDFPPLGSKLNGLDFDLRDYQAVKV
ncbi:hypothetical protein TrVE_jg5327 [Triparma verrucosa]|uniref:Uncharacterized protein n=2 Tax=Triparma TaxID=722752 RepID=A0A9W7EN68_9STRA|nr:hypothetical protein TrST_g13210 [Triparma strigata]GMH85511.1 hypothetical protein TrVE_jg5327 [Triparma verrucosa]